MRELDVIVWATGFDFGTGALTAHGHPRAATASPSTTTGPTARRRSSASRPPASRTSSSPAGRTRRPATTPATTATRSTSSPTRSCTLRERRLRRRSRSTPEAEERWTGMIDEGRGAHAVRRRSASTSAPTSPASRKRYLLNAGGRPKLFKEIARVEATTDYEAASNGRDRGERRAHDPRAGAAAGAVSRNRLRSCSRSHAASSCRYHSSPSGTPSLNRQRWWIGRNEWRLGSVSLPSSPSTA